MADAPQTKRKCYHCIKDRRKCIPSKEGSPICEYCKLSNYDCQINGPGGRKRRKLAQYKCDQCRDAKQKCEPEHRVWPEKCRLCIIRGKSCSEPRAPERKRRRNVSPAISDSATDCTLRRTGSPILTQQEDLTRSNEVQIAVTRPLVEPVKEGYELAKSFLESLKEGDMVPQWVIQECIERMDTLAGLTELPKLAESSNSNATKEDLTEIQHRIDRAVRDSLKTAMMLLDSLLNDDQRSAAADVCSAAVLLHQKSSNTAVPSALPIVHRLACVLELLGQNSQAISVYEHYLAQSSTGRCDPTIVDKIITLQANRSKTLQSFAKQLAPSMHFTGAFFSPLHRAIDVGNYGLAMDELDHPLVNIHAKNADGETVLHRAASADQATLVDVLLRAGATLTAMDHRKRTPLDAAAAAGANSAVCEMIRFGSTQPLHLLSRLEDAVLQAIIHSHEATAIYILQTLQLTQRWRSQDIYYGPDLLCAAAQRGLVKVAAMLLEAVDPDDSCHGRFHVPGEGICALSAACSVADNLEMVKFLIEEDIFQSGDHSPLVCAVRNGDEATVKMLLSYGMNPALRKDASARDTQTLFEIAGELGNEGIVSQLVIWILQSSIPSSERSDIYHKMLKAAWDAGRMNIVKFLLTSELRPVGAMIVIEGNTPAAGAVDLSGAEAVMELANTN